MRQYKIVACILLILSAFGFVLAAPVPVQEVREARANAEGGGENVIIGSGKRGEEDGEPLMQSWAQQKQVSSSYWSTAPWRGSSSAPSGTRPNPSFSSGGREAPLLSTSGGIKVPWNPLAEDDTNLMIQPGTGLSQKPGGVANLIQPGVPTEIQPASLSKSKSVSWVPTKPEVIPPSGDIPTQKLQSPSPLPSRPSRPPKSLFQKIVSKLMGKFKSKP